MNVLMVQGTTSDAGKSTLVAGLCRVFSDSNMSVAPFKPQNMALNSAVTEDGGEIGRAQALQAVAARVPAIVDFNPILLKPNSDTGAQVIVHGKALSNMEAGSYHDYKKVAMDAVLDSHTRLSKRFDVLLVEGAGSPAEINLRENDIANMGYAEEVDCPVIIIADIDKGGVFAHLVGTLALLSQSEQDRVKGFVINRFRGDIALLQSGLDWLEQKTGKPVLGVLPYLHDLALDAEDAVNIANVTTTNEANKTSRVKACVLILPHISNHTDFDALRLNPDIDLEYVRIFDDLPECDLFILPGSKNVIGDLDLIKQQGWPQKLQRHLRYGGKLLGICGGFQMLGKELLDPEHIESSTSKTSGLNFADFTTTLTATKQLTQVTALSHLSKLSAETKDNTAPNTAQNTEQHADGVRLKGYEIHCGVSTGAALKTPAFMLQNKQQSDTSAFSPDGFISHDKQIIGTYIHGLFDSAEFTNELMTWVNPDFSANTLFDLDEHRETQLDRLAQCYREHLDIAEIKSIVGIE